MARLGERSVGKTSPANWHTPVRWRFAIGSIGGDAVLQLETARIADTTFSGEFAQTIQIDKAHARELIELMKRTFNLSE
jgi:hypothetical protein